MKEQPFLDKWKMLGDEKPCEGTLLVFKKSLHQYIKCQYYIEDDKEYWLIDKDKMDVNKLDIWMKYPTKENHD